MKMTVLYHSKTGNTARMAEAVVAGMEAVEGVKAKAFALDAADPDWVKESRCVVIGTPTYYASFSGVVKTWFETAGAKIGLAGKLGGAFATADYVHGGAELAIRAVLDHMLVLGMLTYSGGGALGLPVIHLGPVALKADPAAYEETFRLYGQRMAAKAAELFAAP